MWWSIRKIQNWFAVMVNKKYIVNFFYCIPWRSGLVLFPHCLGEGSNGGDRAGMNRGHQGDRFFPLLSWCVWKVFFFWLRGILSHAKALLPQGEYSHRTPTLPWLHWPTTPIKTKWSWAFKNYFPAVSLGNALKISFILFFTGGSPAALFKVVGKNLWMESKPACKVREGVLLLWSQI